jgi:DNA polymerase III subunit delta
VTEAAPVIYILDGDDEFAINEFIDKMRTKLGDPTIADMNTTRLDGKTFSFPQLEEAVTTVPFLAPRRLVILMNPTARLKDKPQQEKFIELTTVVKPATALVLVEHHFLTTERDRRDGKLHWLERWATAPKQANRVYLRHFSQPSGASMVRWIQDYVKTVDGQLTPQAATSLANQIGDDTRLAAQEVLKLLAYVNYTRPVEADDVDHLTPLSAKVGDFELVNSLRNRDRRKAQALLKRMLEEGDPLQILHSVASQFRSLIIAREIIDAHGSVNDFPKPLKIHPYQARLAMESAPRFSIQNLEAIYHRLLKLDEAIKTGQMNGDLALELLVIELTN